MRVNIFEAKNRLSELVRAAETGKDVVIARHGRPTVGLVPVKPSSGLKGFGSLKEKAKTRGVDKAFTPATERQVVRLFNGDP